VKNSVTINGITLTREQVEGALKELNAHEIPTAGMLFRFRKGAPVPPLVIASDNVALAVRRYYSFPSDYIVAIGTRDGKSYSNAPDEFHTTFEHVKENS
jgi:hypothetical protein